MATPETIDRVFAMFHAEYGSIALERLASGVPDAHGADSGVAHARKWWHQQLRRYTDDVVIQCAQEATRESKRYPPTLPQVRDLCAAETRSREKHVPYALPADRRSWTPAERDRLQRLRDQAAQREAERQIEAERRGWK